MASPPGYNWAARVDMNRILHHQPASDRVPVLYIGGEGRSGSTLLSALIGNYPGFFPVGEFRDIWVALKTNELCGCGEPFAKCEFWRRVGEEAFGGWDQVDAGTMLNADRQYARQRSVLRLLVTTRRRAQSPGLAQHRQTLSSLYAAVKNVSDCSVIVDSSKDASYALLLRGVSGLDLRFIHLIRDSRGVAFSWNRKGIEKPEYVHHPALRFMPRRSWISAAVKWDLKNLMFQYLTPTASRKIVTYESLMSDPEQLLSHILDFANEEPTLRKADLPTNSGFESLPFHTIGGNPIRFKRGPINLRIDEEWRERMHISQRLLVNAVTFPLLIGYGYMRPPFGFRRLISGNVASTVHQRHRSIRGEK